MLTIEDVKARVAAGLTKEDCAEFISLSTIPDDKKALIFMMIWNLPSDMFKKLTVFAGDILPDFINRDFATVEVKLRAAGLPAPMVNMVMAYANSV